MNFGQERTSFQPTAARHASQPLNHSPAALWALLAALVIGSAIGIFYYLRIIYTMTTVPQQATSSETGDMLPGSRVVVYLLILAMLYLGIVPEPLMGYLRTIL